MSSARHRRPPSPVLAQQRAALGALAATGAGAALPLVTATAPAVATPVPGPSAATRAAADPTPSDPTPSDPTPSDPTPSAPSASAPSAGTTRTDGTTHVVRTGEYLTEIARDLCVPGGWQTIYQQNRAVVGPDPNLVRPGQRLRIAVTRCAGAQDAGPGGATGRQVSPPSGAAKPVPAPVRTPAPTPPAAHAEPTGTAAPTRTPAPVRTTAPVHTTAPAQSTAPAPKPAAIWYTAADGSRKSTTVPPSPDNPRRVFYYVSTPPQPPGPLRIADIPAGGGRDAYGVSWQPTPSGRAYQPVVGVYQRGPFGLLGHSSYIVGLAHGRQLSLDWTSAAHLTAP